MANRTDPTAAAVHGLNPQFLIEQIVRNRIYSSTFWKEHCFSLTAETLLDKAVTLKYVRLLGAFYLRLVGKPQEIYENLEPLFVDFRKVRLRSQQPGITYEVKHVDEVIEDLLSKESICGVTLPFLMRRKLLEDNGFEARESSLADLLEVEEEPNEPSAPVKPEITTTTTTITTKEKDTPTNENQSQSTEKTTQLPKTTEIEKTKDKEDSRSHRSERRRSRSREGRHHKRSRSRSNSRSRRRSRSRSREKRHSRHESDSRSSRRREDRDRNHQEKDRGRDTKESSKTGEESMSVEESNALRASLGLPPLRPNKK